MEASTAPHLVINLDVNSLRRENDWQRQLWVRCDIGSRFLSSQLSRCLAKLKSQTSAH